MMAFLERGKPIGAATVLRVGEGSPTRELNEGERNEAFQLAEMLATAALAGRDYFQAGTSYCNRDAFRLVMHALPEQPTKGWTVTTRRRDGSSLNTFPAALPEHRPPHVVSCRTGSIDGELLEALARLRSNEPGLLWDRVWDAITSFNAANTDSDRITKGQEVVLTFGAIQRLLDGSHLIKKFAPVFADRGKPNVDAPAPPELASRHAGMTVREAWIRDLAQVRNAFGHGRNAPDSAPFWSVEEHLLFGAFIFPILLKRLLGRDGLYSVTRADEQHANLFEQLLLCKPFTVASSDDQDVEPDWPWLRVRQATLWAEIRDSAVARMREMDKGASSDSTAI